MFTPGKYAPRFFPVEKPRHRWADRTHLERAPRWCSVDLRDGNQALTVPMSLPEKLDFFALLCRMGFREIEIGFPAASETEFAFVRTLIERDLIPDGVTVGVLTQARAHIIRRTFEALHGCKSAIVHLYIPTSRVQREQVFGCTPDELLARAVEGATLCRDLAAETGVNCTFEFSPESFTATEPDFALTVSRAVLEVWQPTPAHPAILNLPVTVELSSPHVYADAVEYICDSLPCRDAVVVSLHPHNDRGCAVADAELGLLAGADRVEGTLFGNGERTGNVDIVTLALNLLAHGVDPALDLHDLPAIAETYERLTRMPVGDRSPYAGRLVFAAFSGSHQDAIAKSMQHREAAGEASWAVPYLPIDPADVGREYRTDVIRINAQSGKGGIGWLLEERFGYILPKKMREEVGYAVKAASDRDHAELSGEDVLRVFTEAYVNVDRRVKLLDYHFVRTPETHAYLSVELDGEVRELHATGNGRLDAVANAIKTRLGFAFSDMTYEEHAVTSGSSAQAITYVSIKLPDGRVVWGAGLHDDIIGSSVCALFSAVNRAMGE